MVQRCIDRPEAMVGWVLLRGAFLECMWCQDWEKFVVAWKEERERRKSRNKAGSCGWSSSFGSDVRCGATIAFARFGGSATLSLDVAARDFRTSDDIDDLHEAMRIIGERIIRIRKDAVLY